MITVKSHLESLLPRSGWPGGRGVRGESCRTAGRPQPTRNSRARLRRTRKAIAATRSWLAAGRRRTSEAAVSITLVSETVTADHPATLCYACSSVSYPISKTTSYFLTLTTSFETMVVYGNHRPEEAAAQGQDRRGATRRAGPRAHHRGDRAGLPADPGEGPGGAGAALPTTGAAADRPASDLLARGTVRLTGTPCSLATPASP